MTTPLTGGCLCGAVRYRVDAEPLMQAVCHCKNCQRQAGSAWSMIAGVPEAALTVEGEPKTFEDHGESGGVVLRQFCGTCGSTLFWRPEGSSRVDVSAGVLDQPTGLRLGSDSYPQFKGDYYDLGWLT